MGIKITITFQGKEQVIARLSEIDEHAQGNLVKLTKELAADTEKFWKSITHRRTGRLQGGDKTEASGLSFTLINGVYYYKFVNDGHKTPRGWHTRRGYRKAKHITQVEGQLMTENTLEFVEEHILDYLAKFLDGV